jgi:ParB-like chromosome segregation protein Spo0J
MSAAHTAVAELWSIPLDDIVVAEGNQRQDLGDLESLAESMRRIGLVQPPAVRRG